MRRPRARFVLLLTVIACLLAALPAVAATDRDRAGGPPAAAQPEAADGAGDARDTVTTLWDWLRNLLAGEDEASKGDRTPGSGLDPDGHKPPGR